MALAVDRVTDPVEGMHRVILDRSLRWTGSVGAPVRQASDVFIASIYRLIRATGPAVGAAVGLGVRKAVGGGQIGMFSRHPKGSRAQAIINAVWGDELQRRGNDLRVEMGLRSPEGEVIQLLPAGLRAAFPVPTSRLVVLVHGLGQTERCWQSTGASGPDSLWRQLTSQESATPLVVRYNTGRHVRENGDELALLLDGLWRSWPTPIESIALVGYSMGGLVVRSACHAGQVAGHGWVDVVDRVVTLAAPHLGVPLEKAANLVTWGLRIAPHSRPLVGLFDSRSAGIKDLRFGAVAEGERLGSAQDASLQDRVVDLPPLDTAEHHFVATVVTSNPAHPVGKLLGDLMVRTGSGTGRGWRRHIEPADVRVLGGRRHFDLLHDPRVIDQVLAWVSDA